MRYYKDELLHYGIDGMRWGVRNGPPYPIGSQLKNKTPARVDKIRNYKGKLYLISEKDMDGSTLKPRIPQNYFTKNGYEDNQTKRICFAPSVDQCLTALSQNLKNKEFNIYEPSERITTVYKPNKGSVPDSEITGELWVKDPVTLKRVGTIKVTGDDGKDGMRFQYGDHEAYLYGWNYEWVIKHTGATGCHINDRKERPNYIISCRNLRYSRMLSEMHGIINDGRKYVGRIIRGI